MSTISSALLRYGWARDVLWWLARVPGRAWRLLRSLWWPTIFATCVMLIAVADLFGFPANLAQYLQIEPQPGQWRDLQTIATMFLVIAAMWYVRHARRRLVIEEFVDYTTSQTETQPKEAKGRPDDRAKEAPVGPTPDQAKGQASGPKDGANGKPTPVSKGIAALLFAQLDRLHRLYLSVDDQQTISLTAPLQRPLHARIKVEDVGETLRSIVTTESKISVGPIAVSIGPLIALMGRIIGGPRIEGSVHRGESGLILIAQTVGRSPAYTWRVDDAPADARGASGPARGLDQLVEELACRIFTDLALGGSDRWKATSSFSRGLRAYRECLRTPKDRKVKLNQAARHFIETLAEDETFYLAYYNLGVTFATPPLREREAAETAFCEAVRRVPERWEGQYALARSHFNLRNYRAVLRGCAQAVALRPDAASTARIYDLEGIAHREQGAFEPAVASGQAAVVHAWKALCLAELRGRHRGGRDGNAVEKMRALASRCLGTLALTHIGRAESTPPPPGPRRAEILDSARELLQQALRVWDRDSAMYFHLGRVFEAREMLVRATEMYERAYRMEPRNAQYLARLAFVHARLSELGSVHDACKQALHCAAFISFGDAESSEAEHGEATRRWAFGSPIQIRSEALEPAEAVEARCKEIYDYVARAYRWIGEDFEADRVQGRYEFLSNLEEAADGDESLLTIPLREFVEAQVPGREWEAAQVCSAAGRLALKRGRLRDAVAYFERAIRGFDELAGQRGSLSEATRQGLRALLSRALREAGSRDQALAMAQQAVARNPISACERVELGAVYSDLHEYKDARDSWERALLVNPDEPGIHESIAAVRLRLASQGRDPEEARFEREEVTTHLDNALELHSAAGEATLHGSLGMLYFQHREFDEAAKHLGTAKALGVQYPLSDLYLVRACLKLRRYGECRGVLTDLIDKLEKQEREGAQADRPVAPDAEITLGEALGWAYWGRAYMQAQRDGDLDRARKDVDRARHAFNRAHQPPTEFDCAVAMPEGAAAVKACLGWIEYKDDNVDEAIVHLRGAVALVADPETYLHLALAYERKAEKSHGDEAGRTLALRRARSSCQQVNDSQPTDEERRAAKELEDRLASPPKPPTAGVVSNGAVPSTDVPSGGR